MFATTEQYFYERLCHQFTTTVKLYASLFLWNILNLIHLLLPQLFEMMST